MKPDSSLQNIALRLEQIHARITAAAHRAARHPADITLVAVSKTHSPDHVRAAVAAGCYTFGENRVQEAAPKIAALQDLPRRPRWHMIGHLQRNKARLAVELFDLIQSVDSLRLAESLNQHAHDLGRRVPILLQVNVSGEVSKEGFALPGGIANHAAYAQLSTEIERILTLPNLEVRGLMTIPPLAEEPEASRPYFRLLRELRTDLARRWPQANWRDLSMGMSDDFEVAISEEATIIRLGRAIFGER
ncbi:alanine racemase domain protein [Oscillochloris trichoides DG-6]|uniref:Pyridoxal phosphate homeostasis protein n=1 Tax=Oscillochloris trichoides DG-6 TaxID=765420 RepID=E1IB84_9CHLR|nr:YggS family pyridoxal phosphate-dependent enzyme [Oscillochloris trichoides]EFO81569.1 alanine racemase domain protein [Oscillochloris trichoides DG-6]